MKQGDGVSRFAHYTSSVKNMRYLIKVQSHVRTALARFRYRRMKADPSKYALVLPDDPAFWFLFERVPRNEIQNGQRTYKSKIVDSLLERLGPFVYGDPESE